MSFRLVCSSFIAAACCVLLGCNNMPGHPPPGPEVPRPDTVSDFKTLYSQNCSACHGADGHNGPAISLANPEYQAIVDEATLRKWIAQGQPGTLMPAFSQGAGGLLTDDQVDDIVRGMRGAWYKPGALDGQNPPAYAATKPGDPQRGEKAFATFCASCHQQQPANGQQQGASNITDPTFLALASDQSLRSTIIAGRPDLGQPDWRNDVKGRPMTDEEVTDVVAWLASQRSTTPGQPYPEHK